MNILSEQSIINPKYQPWVLTDSVVMLRVFPYTWFRFIHIKLHLWFQHLCCATSLLLSVVSDSTNKLCYLFLSYWAESLQARLLKVSKEGGEGRRGEKKSVLCFLSCNKIFIHVETCCLILWQLSFFKSLLRDCVDCLWKSKDRSFCTSPPHPSKNSHRVVGSDSSH